MFRDEFSDAALAAKAKVKLFRRNPLGFVIASVLAGIFIGFGVLLMCSVGGLLDGQSYAGIVMGISFGIALSLVAMAGAELFTGNNFTITAGLLRKKITLADAAKVLGVCYLGNWAGSVLLALLFWGTGFTDTYTGWFIASIAAAKIGIPFWPLLIRAALCNALVCLAVWCCFRCKCEIGKLVMIFGCVAAFVISGFEHSIANMTLLTIAFFVPFTSPFPVSGYFYNLLVVTLGNMTGGICVALAYYVVARKKKS